MGGPVAISPRVAEMGRQNGHRRLVNCKPSPYAARGCSNNRSTLVLVIFCDCQCRTGSAYASHVRLPSAVVITLQLNSRVLVPTLKVIHSTATCAEGAAPGGGGGRRGRGGGGGGGDPADISAPPPAAAGRIQSWQGPGARVVRSHAAIRHQRRL